MISLLDRLPVEVRGELRKVLGVVVDGNRDVLLRRRELVRDLAVEGVSERGHAATLSSRALYLEPMPGVPTELKGRSFTRVASWSRSELETLLDLADELKAERARRPELRVLPGRTIGLIFHKPSTRTRVAFEVGIAELGGMALFLPAAELQLARGESYRDTALVLSRFLSALMIRTFEQDEVEEFAEHASIPVINGLTDLAHPLQALADAMTLRERFGTLAGLRVAYVGDGNNVCHSLLRIAGRFGMSFVAATPPGYEPDEAVVAAAAEDAAANGGSVDVVADARQAAEGALAVYTDVWTSMGQDADRERRVRDLAPYRIDDALLGIGRSRCRRDALPPRARRRGDHLGRSLRSALPRLGAGGEPPAHAEGADGARHPVTFDEHVRAALDELPADLAAALENIAVVVEDENPEDPDLLGLYHGVPLPERGDMAGVLPDTISIYRIPLEESFPDPNELRDEIRITVLHELGHYFGLDEDAIAALGYD